MPAQEGGIFVREVMLITLERLSSRISRQVSLAQLPGTARVQVAQTAINPTTRGFTVILRANAALNRAIETGEPYTYPSTLYHSYSHMMAVLMPWLQEGELVPADNELCALCLCEASWDSMQVTVDELAQLITVPRILQQGGERWREYLKGLPTLLVPAQAANAPYITIVTMPERVPLIGSQDLRQHALVSYGWNVLGNDESAITGATRSMREAVDRAGPVLRAT